MIPANAITEWGVNRSWATREQIEQDLLLSRSICAIAGDPYLGAELVFRGGTALHKLHLGQAFRYSEDLDYVRRSASGIAPLTKSLTRLGVNLGFEVRTRVGVHPRVYWRTMAETGVPLRIKIEVNTHERSPALPIEKHEHRVESSGLWSAPHERYRSIPSVELGRSGSRLLFPAAAVGSITMRSLRPVFPKRWP